MIECKTLNEDIDSFKDSVKIKKSIRTIKDTIKLLYDNLEEEQLVDFLSHCQKKFDI